MWLSGSNATMVVDITKRFKYKHAALKRHVSQVGDNKGLKKMLQGVGARRREERGHGQGPTRRRFQGRHHQLETAAPF